ncbi:MAG: radical SAM protein [Desulfobacterales bacterium]
MIDRKSRAVENIFGPVPSRRLGMSLGVDLMPHKTCSLDCVYCECGATTHLTLVRDDYISTGQIKAELKAVLSQSPSLDTITFSGSGEPTLHRGIGEIIRFIRTNYPQYKVAVLTNGTLFNLPEVREQLRDVDVVKVSLDAVTTTQFDSINRPCVGLRLADIIEGLVAFRKTFLHQFWVEVFLVPGFNDTKTELAKIKDVLQTLNPDRVQLNALDRPGTEDWVRPADSATLKKTAAYLLDAEIIGHPDAEPKDLPALTPGAVLAERLYATIKRRPCTADDISRLLGIDMDEVGQHLDALIEKGTLIRKQMPRGIFYMVSV